MHCHLVIAKCDVTHIINSHQRNAKKSLGIPHGSFESRSVIPDTRVEDSVVCCTSPVYHEIVDEYYALEDRIGTLKLIIVVCQ